MEDIMYIKGVGPKRFEALIKSGIHTIYDLITYFPTAYINRESAGKINNIHTQLLNQFNPKLSFTETENSQFYSIQKEFSIIGTIHRTNVRTMQNNKKMLTLSMRDSNNESFEIVFFRGIEYFITIYTESKILVINGIPTINDYSKLVSFSHPDIEIIEEEDILSYSKGGIIPKYKITEEMRKCGISIRIMRKIIHSALEIWRQTNSSNVETLPEYLIKENNLCPLSSVINILHNPTNFADIDSAKYRIKFEEIFWYQLVLNSNRASIRREEQGIKITEKSKLARKLYDFLPFKLTSDQKKVLNDFANDFASGKPMSRLLQGDVGSGKTIVAVLAMMMIIDAGYQVAMMCPTELLAEQHYLTITNLLNNRIENNDKTGSNDKIENKEKQNAKQLLEWFNNFEPNAETSNNIGLQVELLLGGSKTKVKKEILNRIECGISNIVIGTHSLFQKSVAYNNLGLVIIDEQHRFGVEQRSDLLLLAKQSITDQAISPHILYMTATPIPRTMTMTLYGDLDVSVIKTKPANRLPIKTKVCFESQRDQVYEFLHKELNKGRQVYIVYPLVEKSEKLELKSAVEHYEIIANEIFPEYKCGLLHGQLSYTEKENVMQQFKRNDFQILVATTVVEVGIDVSNATIMLIEDAERFGLAQLHQLRGRVGRDKEQSYCFLMTKDNFKFKFSHNTKNIADEKINSVIRLKAMQETNDGFKLSEIDMKLRGPGDILGTKQSGLPDFKYIDLVNDTEIIQTAANIAKQIISNDALLEQEKNAILKQNYNQHINNNSSFINIA